LSCGGPDNVDCGNAIPFCGNVVQSFGSIWAAQYNGCLWYSFELPEATLVDLTVSSTGSQISLYGPQSPEGDCPSCGDQPPLQGGQGQLNVQSTLAAGHYFIGVSIQVNAQPPLPVTGPVVIDVVSGLECVPCVDCIPPFELEADKEYIITAWAHVPGLPGNTLTFTTPEIIVESPILSMITSFGTSGNIIDGWQRMEHTFTTPANYTSLRVLFTSTGGAVHYDDIRLFPEKGSMKSYVYDPINLRFIAELDERHYATFYEYDGEGNLVRVKKETERGVMTTQETKNNSSKLNNP